MGFETWPHFYSNTLRSNDINSLQRFIFRLTYENVETYLTENGLVFDKDIELLVRLFTSGAVVLTIDWALGRIPMTAEKLANLIVRSVPVELHPYIL